MGNFFQALFDRKCAVKETAKPAVIEAKLETAEPKTETSDESSNNVHVVFFVNLDNTVTYTIIHCKGNISEGELAWDDYKHSVLPQEAVAEAFTKWLAEAHPKASFKFTELHV